MAWLTSQPHGRLTDRRKPVCVLESFGARKNLSSDPPLCLALVSASGPVIIKTLCSAIVARHRHRTIFRFVAGVPLPQCRILKLARHPSTYTQAQAQLKSTWSSDFFSSFSMSPHDCCCNEGDHKSALFCARHGMVLSNGTCSQH